MKTSNLNRNNTSVYEKLLMKLEQKGKQKKSKYFMYKVSGAPSS